MKNPRPRPEPGTVTNRIARLKICKRCGYLISDTGLCHFECELDVDGHTPKDYVFAVYEVTEKFLRDEPGE